MKKILIALMLIAVICLSASCMVNDRNETDALVKNTAENTDKLSKKGSVIETGRFATLSSFSRIAFAVDMKTGKQVYACDAEGECDHLLNSALCMFKNSQVTFIDCNDKYIVFGAISSSEDSWTTGIYVFNIEKKNTICIYKSSELNITFLNCAGNEVIYGLGSSGTAMVRRYNIDDGETESIYLRSDNPDITYLDYDESSGEHIYCVYGENEIVYYITDSGKFDKSKPLSVPDTKTYSYTSDGYFYKSAKPAAVYEYVENAVVTMPSDKSVTHIISGDGSYCFMTMEDGGLSREMSGSGEKNDYYDNEVYIVKKDGTYSRYELHSDFYGTPEAVYNNCILFDLLYYYENGEVREAIDNGLCSLWVNLETGDAVIYRNVDTETETVTVAEQINIRVDKITN